MVRTLWLLLVVFGCLAGSTGCSPKTPSAGSAEKPKVEAALAFTDLLQEEYDKLKIKTQAAAVEDVMPQVQAALKAIRPSAEVRFLSPQEHQIIVAVFPDLVSEGLPAIFPGWNEPTFS